MDHFDQENCFSLIR